MDINKCRICLEKTNSLITLFDGVDSALCCKIMNLANVEISPNDGLPSSICVNCNQKLNECIEFISLCKNSDYVLRNTTSHASVEAYNTIQDNSECKINKEIENVDFERESTGELQRQDENTVVECCTKVESVERRKLAQKQQCFTCGKIMSSRFRLKTHLATHIKDKQHSCTYCAKQFTIVENLNAHIRIHTGEKPYCCTFCGETFAQSSGLIVHKRKHTGQMPYQCVLCPRSFQTIGNFQYHVRVHTGERKYSCNTCGRAFITNGDLKQHIATHSGEKPHICAICGVRFSRASNLKRHVTFLHNAAKSFSCQYCPLKFGRKIDHFKHEKTHKNK